NTVWTNNGNGIFTNSPQALGTGASFSVALGDLDGDGDLDAMVANSGQSNTVWTNDGNGNFESGTTYMENLEWDTDRYINVYTMDVYTNTNFLVGYATMPWYTYHKVVVDWRAYGRDGPVPPLDQGRILTHEIGHYLGLFHTFEGGCGNSDCYGSGDFICDTNPQQYPDQECSLGTSSCGSVDPIQNYMGYSPDLCKNNFTPEQILRMRYALVHYRPLLYSIDTDCPADLDGNGAVDGADLAIVLGAWGSSDATADVIGDPLVDGADLAAILAAWGSCTQ
ncbi:MAG: M43 family zinc metalloprotease, partial [Planctomycetota bacterium]|nr:M43 family zinc metalloprotease [Planctomycetota bacterium]